MKKTFYRDNSRAISLLGLQPGEAYEQSDECHTRQSFFYHNGRKIEVYFDEMAGPLSQWKAFCMGVGTVSGLERSNVIHTMKLRLI